jgi:hypothetical protein
MGTAVAARGIVAMTVASSVRCGPADTVLTANKPPLRRAMPVALYSGGFGGDADAPAGSNRMPVFAVYGKFLLKSQVSDATNPQNGR